MLAFRRLLARWRRRKVRIVTFLYELPDALPFADGATFSFELDERLDALEDVAWQPTRAASPMPIELGSSFASLRFWQTDSEPDYGSPNDPLSQAIRKALPPQFHPAADERPKKDSLFERLQTWWWARRVELDTSVSEPPRTYRTVVEAVTPVDFRRGERALSDAFDVCLDKVADLVRAYRNYSHHPVHHVTRQRLPLPYALYVLRTLDTPPKWAEGLSMMLLHLNVPELGPDELLTAEEAEAMMGHLSVMMRGHPLPSFAERALDARVALELDGDYSEAVVQTQISCEILLDGVLTLLLWEERRKPEEAARLFEEGLSKRVRMHYSGRLGGDWNPRTSPPLSAWREKVAYVRGRVVHSGYRPTFEEAIAARTAASGLEDFVKERVVARRTQFPRTTLLTVGRPGLERMGLWSGQIKRFGEAADEEPDWLASYSEWREQFDTARS